MTNSSSHPSGGGSFLTCSAGANRIFTREDLDDDHRAIARTVDEFWAQDVAPALDALHRHTPGVARRLLRQAASLGLTSMQVPEAYGGLALGLPAVMVTIERLGRDASYLGWHLGHSGIGMLPLILYGTDDQKQRYLPRLLSVDLLGAYALTEPHAGTDALAIRTRADLTPDGRHYVLNGQKMWITNGGEADLFTVFAKVNGEAFTAFLVERAVGVTSGPEEHKMGLAGTSTTPVYFDNVRVPIENVLGDVGRGHYIAFNILNIGRLELGPNMIGGAKAVLDACLAYASSREAFGGAIARFGAIRHKLADCAVRIFAAESATWRTVGLVDADIARRRTGTAAVSAEADAFEEFAAECSIVKVVSSEMLDQVADHGVQVHGGYGYHRDYFVERAYRDARINRVFEGTNEINRLIIPDLVARRAGRAGRRLDDEAATVFARLTSLAGMAPAREDGAIVANARTIALLVLGALWRHPGATLREPQEVVMGLADTIIETFVMESAHLRAQQMRGTNGADLGALLAGVALRDALARVAQTAATALQALLTGDEARTALAAVRALSATEPADTIAMRQAISRHLLDARTYPL